MPQTFSSLSGESPRLLLGAQKGQPQTPCFLPLPPQPPGNMDLHLSFWQCYHEAGVHASTETTQKAIQSVPLQISHWSPKKKNNFWTRGVKNEEEFEIWRLFKLSKIASSQKLDLPSFHSPPYPAKKKPKKIHICTWGNLALGGWCCCCEKTNLRMVFISFLYKEGYCWPIHPFVCSAN